MPKMCKIAVRSRTFRYVRRNSEPCLLFQVKNLSVSSSAGDSVLQLQGVHCSCSRVHTGRLTQPWGVLLVRGLQPVVLPKPYNCVHCPPLCEAFALQGQMELGRFWRFLRALKIQANKFWGSACSGRLQWIESATHILRNTTGNHFLPYQPQFWLQ